MVEIVFYASAAIAVFCTVMTITSLNPVHALLYLIVSLLSLALIFFVLGAPFAALLEVIVYAGAIMVLFLFVVMLLNAPHEETVHDEHVHPLLRPGPMRFGAVLAVAFAGELVWALTRSSEPDAFAPGAVSSVASIGRMLFTDYAFPFEVTSVLILVAMMGAVVLARRD